MGDAVLPTPASPLDASRLLGMYREMLRIRRFEERALYESSLGHVHGALHSYIGQEAVAVGVCAHLEPEDYVTSTHRGHGHAIAKGARVDRMMAELFGRETGYCRGKGGSMHIADLEIGMLGANGIVAGGIAVAAGAAWAASLRGESRVAVCFFGESAANRGPFHEGVNLAAAWDLPVLYLCENNGYGQYTAAAKTTRVESVADRASAYGVPAATADGQDIAAVYDATADALEYVRGGEGPFLLECKTYRYLGHALGDSEYYRPQEEVERWRARDPLTLAAERLGLDEQTRVQLDAAVERELDEAVRFAEESPYPDPSQVDEDVFAE